ncbi:MAG: bifunctional demethylmenaquinone methyltransferase/2-methoxy-6-polyprenyl-1,4-benzoquinol methylase UbiE [Bacteroidetes bacterium]|nr:bifunctional demethylmenaquinone methyltransferase/2-methoxy-6-polyprenyl-1,4-benzoquinol methylase UbiE [Bacteroidota bacterium]
MFDNIAWRYDFLNHFLSFGIDRRWRKRAIHILSQVSPETILDVACGTGDMSIEALKLKPRMIIGVDISEGMLAKGREKLEKKNLENIITLVQGDSDALQFDDQAFDAAMVAFGVRNFEDMNQGLAEILRVLKPGGLLVVLEFSKPRSPFFKNIFNLYFFRILPFVGSLFSKDASAYRYLPASVNAFPDRISFLDIMRKVGFTDNCFEELTMGIACLYYGKKELHTK